MNSIINIGGDSQLLQLVLWFQAEYQKGTIVSVQVGSRAPLIYNNNEPLTKMYFYDIVSKTNLPVFCVAYNSLKIPIDISRYEEGKISKIGNEEIVLNFVYNLLKSAKSLPQKYYAIKQDEQKYARGKALSNLVRAENQFLKLYERNDEIQQIKAAEQEQEKNQKDISVEIIKIKNEKIDFKVLIVLFLFFLCSGIAFQKIRSSQPLTARPNQKTKRQGKKTRNGVRSSKLNK